MSVGLTPLQAGRLLGISKDGVLNLIRAGELVAFTVGLGKQRIRYRISEAEIDAFVKRRSTAKPSLRRTRKSAPPVTREWV